MFQKIRSIFGMVKKMPRVPNPTKCLVDIKLSGQIHSFYLDLSFVESLNTALVSSCGGFFEHRYKKSGYAINLNNIDYVESFLDAIEIENGDVDGCSVWLADKEKAIRLGQVESFEAISQKLTNDFIQLGRHWFPKHQIALIVVQDSEKNES